MARKFNGTTQSAWLALDHSAYSQITVSFWGWWDSLSSNSGKSFLEGADPAWTPTGYLSYFDFASGHFIGIADAAGNVWTDYFTRPSAAAWHHYMHVFTRSTPSNAAWVDGVSQSLTTSTHTASTYGNFPNSNFNIAGRAHTSLFGACSVAEVAIWGGVALNTNHALGLAAGCSPYMIRPDSLFFYTPLHGGDSPEPGYKGKNVTLVASPSNRNHPRCGPGVIRPR